MVEIINLSSQRLNTPEACAASDIENKASRYFSSHQGISGFLLLIPSVYTYNDIHNDIDIAIFGKFNGLETPDGYAIDSFAAAIEVKSHPAERIYKDPGHHYHVAYSDGDTDVTVQSLLQAIALKKHLNKEGIKCDFVVSTIYFRSIGEDALNTLRNGINDYSLSYDFTFEQIIEIIRKQLSPKASHNPVHANNLTIDNLTDVFSHVTAPVTLRNKFELICSESLDPLLSEIKSRNKDILISGKAGTGKTLLLLKAAMNIVENPDCNIIFLTYNHALLTDIKKLLKYFPGCRLKPNDFMTIESFFQRLMRKNKIISNAINPTRSTNYNKEYIKALDRLIKKAEDKEIIYYPATHFVLDEAQDLLQQEADLLYQLFPATSLLLAEGIDQKIRNENPPEWKSAETIKTLSCKRMFSNVAMFVNLLAEKLESDWHIDCTGAFPGGRIIILDHYSPTIHKSLLQTQRQHGCCNYDMLMLVDPKQTCESLDAILDSLYDGRISENRKNEPGDDEARLYYYQSCRGVEGWTVVCFGLDRYYEEEYDKRKSKIEQTYDSKTRNNAINEIALKMMIPLTRAIDTLVIVLQKEPNHFSDVIHTAASLCKDFTEYEVNVNQQDAEAHMRQHKSNSV